MATYLADTNLLLRLADAASNQHLIAVEALATLFNRGDEIFLTAQNFIEFRAVATRPVAANGLGWNSERTTRETAEMQQRFRFLKDSPEIFTRWLELVRSFSVTGKRVHDARLVAVLEVYAVENLITFNIADFGVFPSVSLVDPRSLAMKAGAS
jgi:predicted nucleic acid-binding protein